LATRFNNNYFSVFLVVNIIKQLTFRINKAN